MESISEARKELSFHRDFAGLIEVIKEIAASQFRLMETSKERRFAKFLESFEGFFKLLGSLQMEDVFTRAMSDVTGIIIITSDEGFMGGLNTSVIHTALEKVQNGKKKIIVVGGQGANYLKDLNIDYIPFQGVLHEERYERAVEIKDFITAMVLKKEIGRVYVVYPKPVSLTSQVVEVAALLPFTELFFRKGVSSKEKEEKIKNIVIESSPKKILDYLVGMWMTYKLYEVFEDSKLAELSARMVSLEESYSSLKRQVEILKYRYFRSYHEMIDKGMREIFAAKALSVTRVS